MRWITHIAIDNYRAFGKAQDIAIPTGQHLLVYGENGSGKSSIYNALKDFFASSFPAAGILFNLNHFEKSGGNTSGQVKITIAEKAADNTVSSKNYLFTEPDGSCTHRQPEIQAANKVKGFLDYKRMLQAHALEVPATKQPNFFRLIVKELLGEHRVPNPAGGTTTVQLIDEYKRLSEILCKKQSNSQAYKTAQAELDKLDAELLALLKKVFDKSNKFLDEYFKNKLQLDIRYTNLKVHRPTASQSRQMLEELGLRVKYAGKEFDQYHVVLNEARLSAFAVCLYLASIKTNPLPATDLRVLYLDDVFIGLDTSNRIPLLEIVLAEFMNDGFQVFISTYDREWYELARLWFDQKKIPVKWAEFYAETDDSPTTPDTPVMIDKDLTPLQKASQYLKAKDYPAAGNYLRKACEEAIILQLLDHRAYLVDDQGGTIKELEQLLQQLQELYTDSNVSLPAHLLDAIRIYKKAILNPSSHSDLKSPIFRRELDEAMKLATTLQNLPRIERRLLCNAGTVFTYDNPGASYHAEVRLADAIFRVGYDGTVAFSKHKFRVNTWTWNGVEYAIDAAGTVMALGKRENFCEQKKELASIFYAINQTAGIPIPTDPQAEITVGSKGTLRDLLK